MIVREMLEQAGLFKENGRWKDRVGFYEIHLTGRDGETEPKTVKGGTMVQLFYNAWTETTDHNGDTLRFPKLVRILRYSGYDLHEGTALARWMVNAAYLTELDAFTKLRLEVSGHTLSEWTLK
jgi:hypothetical protein